MPLQLTFLNGSVRELCECMSVAERALGTRAARRLRSRLSDIFAAERIHEVVAGSPKILVRGRVIFLLHPPHKLILEPAIRPIPKTRSGLIDWDAIDRYCVIQVGQPNG